MTRAVTLRLALGFGLLFGTAINAQDTETASDELPVIPGAEAVLDDYLWSHRPVVVFADSERDPRFVEQMEFLRARPEALLERDVVVITDTSPRDESDLRRKLRPRGFMLVLIGKDGAVKLRKPSPWNVRELSRSIDKMPIRMREIREGLGQ